MVAIAQKEFKEVVKDVDGDLSPLQLAEQLIGFEQDAKRIRDGQKRVKAKLVQYSLDKGVRESPVGDLVLVISPKFLKVYNKAALAKLKGCTTPEQILRVLTELPSGKQLKALIEQAGATAASVINGATSKDDTGDWTVKLRKPRKSGGRRGGRYGRR